jgi:hypothetical protein
MNSRPKYKPAYAKVVPWEEIAERYAELISLGIDLEPMLALVKHIMESGLGQRLFAFVAMRELVISIYDPIDIGKEVLHIEYNDYSSKWYFEFRPKPYSPFEALRYYPKELGIKKFDQYIKMLKW